MAKIGLFRTGTGFHRHPPTRASVFLHSETSKALAAINLFFLTLHLHAVTFYVNAYNASPTPPYTNWSTAASTIQAAVDISSNGDLILVTNGIYATGGRALASDITNRVTVTNAITVRSVNGPAVTLIEGYQFYGTAGSPYAVRCAYLGSGAVLSGFSLFNGEAGTGNYVNGGGVCGGGSSSVVSNCAVFNNICAGAGGGAYAVTLTDCSVSGNSGQAGGGAGSASLIRCSVTINSALEGGGTFGCTATNCSIFNNSASDYGGGSTFSTLVNCTVVDNTASDQHGAGGGGGSYQDTLLNCVVYDNTCPSGSNYYSSKLTNCCAAPLAGGPGNFANDPVLVSLITKDFHLQSNSPCVNAGNNACQPGTTDFDNKPRIVGGTVDVGAYEYQGTVRYVRFGNTNPISPYSSWSVAATNLQDAIDAASDGDLVLVTNGVYATGGRVIYGVLTNRVAINKAVTVQSINGPAVTMICGYQIPSGSTAYSNNVRCVYLTNSAVLNGFTLTNGATLAAGTDIPELAGGGVYCETTNEFLTNCVLTGNVCNSKFAQAGGGGIFQGTLVNCVLSNNLVSSYGAPGGAADKSTLNGCLIVSNSASSGGGAANSVLNHCAVIKNVAPYFGSTSSGGGTYMCTANYCLIAGNLSTTAGGGDYDGTLNDCILSNNVCLLPSSASGNGTGAGSYQQAAGSIHLLNNCLVVSNYCYGFGGGVYVVGSSPALINCTIVGNTATNRGGGVYSGVLRNCIVNGNHCSSVAYGYTSNYYNTSLNNGWTNDPSFVDPAGGDYHLQSQSPCINSGNNTYVSGATDLDGKPRIAGGTVDIGTFEYQTPASVISYAWLQQYGLPTDGSVDYLDSDGTGMNNWQKWIAGLNPTNPASILAMSPLVATNNADGVIVTWQSVATRTYYLQRASDLTAQPAFSAIQSNLVGQAGTTSFTDTSATNNGPYFYRVGVQ